MSLLNSNSGAHFLDLSAYNKFRSFVSPRSDSSVSDAESIQSSRAEEQADPSLRIFLNLSDYNRFRSLTSRRSHSSISDAESIQSSQAEDHGDLSLSAGDCITIPCTDGEILSSPNLKAFSFNDLKSATGNFRPDSIIGEGGFGCVYKGWIDEQTFTASKPGVGMVVAVKKFTPEGFQGHKEWLTEIRYLSQLHHPNLVKLIGFCSYGDNRLLVYEFVPRGSLDIHLFGSRAQSLSWDTRIKVAIGAAKGLALLHDAQNQVIHRDVKSSNILLDLDFNAKLSDFGLARAGPTGDMTHVSTRVVGTYGYAAPEYVATGCLSAKADVYSLGVMLLELLLGRRAFDASKSDTEHIYSCVSFARSFKIKKSDTKQLLVDWAKPYLKNKRKLFRIVDSKLKGQFPKKEAHAMAKLASLCIANDPKFRPHMSEVLAVLEKLQDP